MYKKCSQIFSVLPIFLLLSCESSVTLVGNSPEENVNNISACPIIESDKWYAWLDKFEQEKGIYRLNVKGEVSLPNPAYDIEWSVGPMDRMNPPGLRLFLKPKANDGMSIQVITNVPVTYQLDTPIVQYRYISIYCDNVEIARISDVNLTD